MKRVILQLFVYLLISNQIFSCDGGDIPGQGPDDGKPALPAAGAMVRAALHLAFQPRAERRGTLAEEFRAQVGEFLALIESTPHGERNRHICVFDVHGTLTSLRDPRDPHAPERPFREIIDLYRRLQSSGVTVLISSAWNDIDRIRVSLACADIAADGPHQTSMVDGHQIWHFANFVSAREPYTGPSYDDPFTGRHVESGEMPTYLKSKGFAALWYVRTHGIGNVLSMTLFDDDRENCETFQRQISTGAFGIIIPLERIHTILVPRIDTLEPTIFTAVASTTHAGS